MNMFIALLLAMSLQESNGGRNVKNDEGAVGEYQIRQACVDDLNYYYKTQYRLEDFENRYLARWAVLHYGKMYGAQTCEEIARIWNGGPNGMSKESTLRYWNEVREKMDKISECSTDR